MSYLQIQDYIIDINLIAYAYKDEKSINILLTDKQEITIYFLARATLYRQWNKLIKSLEALE